MTQPNAWSVEPESDVSQTSYWASYSDLMAGILLVFALAAVTSSYLLKSSLVEPTQTLNAWDAYLNAVCADERLQTLETEGVISIDCDTGGLVLSEASLRYPNGSTELSDEGKSLLERVVPVYLRTVQAHLDPEHSIDINGIEISGHTDSTGDYGSNTWFSRERAGKVFEFLRTSPALAAFRSLLENKAYTAGYADSRPPLGILRGGESAVARRIELQVQIENVSILRDLRALLNQITGAR